MYEHFVTVKCNKSIRGNWRVAAHLKREGLNIFDCSKAEIKRKGRSYLRDITVIGIVCTPMFYCRSFRRLVGL